MPAIFKSCGISMKHVNEGAYSILLNKTNPNPGKLKRMRMLKDLPKLKIFENWFRMRFRGSHLMEEWKNLDCAPFLRTKR